MPSKMKCGHPSDWAAIRLVHGGQRFTYCIGCLIEKVGLKNLEAYDNPLIKFEAKKNETVKSKTKAEPTD